MSDVIISAENVGKSYILDHRGAGAGGYRKFSDTLIHTAKAPLRWLKTGNGEQRTGNSREEFWALKDVSFEIKRGEVVGIIGRNGAGKSTLLKILSRITEPTKGRITLDGRVASLLEVGTGFHPELSGRENIYLNGAILGMRKEEIRSKFDEIVAFAEIERFLDTPVKRYSSGMYVRLAFAVAAHLEPEILIVDEVLAVGDQRFQQKCIGKMNDVASGGRTVLLVSHNMAVISSLCEKALLLSAGRTQGFGASSDILKLYAAAPEAEAASAARICRRIDSSVEITALSCAPETVQSGDEMQMVLEMEASKETQIDELCLLIYHSSSQRVGIIDLRQSDGPYPMNPVKPAQWKIKIPSIALVEGEYSIGLYCRTPESRGDHYDLRTFSVMSGMSSSLALPYSAEHRGYLEFTYNFSHTY
ncbi:ABC transporter ATP-binding protein [Brevifollis gellanilyticus]|uniref:ABC transporter domain-containing protein n=1 Tax=Brevifollis gellanilyticus TaxID=748831 RepID=A0A512M9Y9_9BACT|nr:ABC transporter ATP-binding protein [Brevifollis gellanilyticus]GEP43542.1 hypothetical protein BGE01nite_28330 [Brevifollis gellanilyticus]